MQGDAMTEKEQFLGQLERELPTTMRVLRAYPAAKADLKPHARCKSAKELAWIFVTEQKASDQDLDVGIEFGKMPNVPATLLEVIATYEQRRHRERGPRGRERPDAFGLHAHVRGERVRDGLQRVEVAVLIEPRLRRDGDDRPVPQRERGSRDVHARHRIAELYHHRRGRQLLPLDFEFDADRVDRERVRAVDQPAALGLDGLARGERVLNRGERREMVVLATLASVELRPRDDTNDGPVHQGHRLGGLIHRLDRAVELLGALRRFGLGPEPGGPVAHPQLEADAQQLEKRVRGTR